MLLQKHLRYDLLFSLLWALSLTACQSQNEPKEKINFQVNFNVINKEGKEEKEILAFWETYLNSDDLVQNHENDWITEKGFSSPSYCLVDIRKMNKKDQVTVIALNKEGDFYRIKTMLSYYNDSLKITRLFYIFNTYVKKVNQQWKLFNVSEYMMSQMEYQKYSNIDFYYSTKHRFDKKIAAQTDSLNHFLAKQFKVQVIDFQYIICKNTEETECMRGFDFSPAQFTPIPYAGSTDINNKIIYAGNDSEFYPHEQVHLYTYQYAENNGTGYHQWADEGIAAFFGGCRGLPLDVHLKALQAFFKENLTLVLSNNINDLDRPLKDGSLVGYYYSLGGLICKKIYEKEGMNGLLDFFANDGSDDAYYAAVKKHLGISKEEFGSKMKEMVLAF
jgi:hypothetical protein